MNKRNRPDTVPNNVAFILCIPYAPISSWLNNVKPIFWLKETPILIFRKWASRYLHITACPARTDMYDFYVYIYMYISLSLALPPSRLVVYLIAFH